MAATMTQTAHASVSAFWNVRSQLERYVQFQTTSPERRSKRVVRHITSVCGLVAFQPVSSIHIHPVTIDPEV